MAQPTWNEHKSNKRPSLIYIECMLYMNGMYYMYVLCMCTILDRYTIFCWNMLHFGSPAICYRAAKQQQKAKRVHRFCSVLLFFSPFGCSIPTKKNRITPNWNIFLFGGPLYFCVHYWNCRFHCCGIEITVLFLQPAIVIFSPHGRICSHYA